MGITSAGNIGDAIKSRVRIRPLFLIFLKTHQKLTMDFILQKIHVICVRVKYCHLTN